MRWVNDSQATIPVAAMAALEAFDAPIVLIAGGKDKGLDYAAFADAIAARCRARRSSSARPPRSSAALIGGRVPVRRVPTMDEAVRRGRRRCAEPGDVVLLVTGGGELRHVRRLRGARRRVPRRGRRAGGGPMTAAAVTAATARRAARGVAAAGSDASGTSRPTRSCWR